MILLLSLPKLYLHFSVAASAVPSAASRCPAALTQNGNGAVYLRIDEHLRIVGTQTRAYSLIKTIRKPHAQNHSAGRRGAGGKKEDSKKKKREGGAKGITKRRGGAKRGRGGNV